MTRWVLVYGPVWLPVSSDNLFCVHGADPRIPDQLPGGTRTVSGRTLCVGPVASEISVTRMCGPSAVAGPAQLLVDGVLGLAQTNICYRSATLLLWVLSGPVLKHGPRSLTCARVIGTAKPKGVMKVKVDLASTEGGWVALRCSPALPGRLVLIASRGAPRAYTLGPERW